MTGHLIPGLVILAAALAGLNLLLIHGMRDHGWPERMRRWLAGMPPPLVPRHVHWYQSQTRLRRWTVNAVFVIGCELLALLFLPEPWAVAGIAWGCVGIAAELEFVPRHRHPGGENHAHP